jgi:hypothetical protein
LFPNFGGFASEQLFGANRCSDDLGINRANFENATIFECKGAVDYRPVDYRPKPIAVRRWVSFTLLELVRRFV